MLRILLLFLFAYTTCQAQQPGINLSYAQTVYENGVEKTMSERRGFKNVFNPHFISLGESNENLTFDVHIRHDSIFVESTLTGSKTAFSKKYQVNETLYYLNLLTGEKKKFNYQNRLSKSNQLVDKLKGSKRKSPDMFGCKTKTFKATYEENELHLVVCADKQYDSQKGLFSDFFYQGKLILEKRFIDQATNTETIMTLTSVDTLRSATYIQQAININQVLVLANQGLTIDSIDFDVEIPDIYYKDVADESITSLNVFKGNGKYLLVDFWGTWCKPCLASIPALKEFYEKHIDIVDVLSMDFKDANLDQVKKKIEETGMYWPQGIATEKINTILNPQSLFPGILLFDDEMKLVLREPAKIGLIKATEIIENR